jgi:hypothetical protein
MNSSPAFGEECDAENRRLIPMAAIVLQHVTKTMIGRFCPGFYLLLMGCWCTNTWPVFPVVASESNMQVLVLVFLGYGLGCVFDALGHSIFDREIFTFGARVALPKNTTPEHQYDVLRLTDPVAGLRLVKLASERDACRCIILGTPLVVFLKLSVLNSNDFSVHGFRLFNSQTPFMWVILALPFMASILHLRHLKIRFTEALMLLQSTTKTQVEEKSPSEDG